MRFASYSLYDMRSEGNKLFEVYLKLSIAKLGIKLK